jgi:hypothetical protein
MYNPGDEDALREGARIARQALGYEAHPREERS